MGTWIIEGSKLRPTYPECSFKGGTPNGVEGKICGGATAPITFPPWECGTLIVRAGKELQCCNDNVQLQCEECAMVACEPCMAGRWTGR